MVCKSLEHVLKPFIYWNAFFLTLGHWSILRNPWVPGHRSWPGPLFPSPQVFSDRNAVANRDKTRSCRKLCNTFIQPVFFLAVLTRLGRKPTSLHRQGEGRALGYRNNKTWSPEDLEDLVHRLLISPAITAFLV